MLTGFEQFILVATFIAAVIGLPIFWKLLKEADGGK